MRGIDFVGVEECDKDLVCIGPVFLSGGGGMDRRWMSVTNLSNTG